MIISARAIPAYQKSSCTQNVAQNVSVHKMYTKRAIPAYQKSSCTQNVAHDANKSCLFFQLFEFSWIWGPCTTFMYHYRYRYAWYIYCNKTEYCHWIQNTIYLTLQESLLNTASRTSHTVHTVHCTAYKKSNKNARIIIGHRLVLFGASSLLAFCFFVFPLSLSDKDLFETGSGEVQLER